MKRFLFAIIYLFTAISAYSQLEEKSNYHIIIAFDNLVPHYNLYYDSKKHELQKKIEESISKCTDNIDVVHISYINFSQRNAETTLSANNFCNIYKENESKHIFQYSEGKSKWQGWAGNKGGTYSFLSIAKQECLHSMFGNTDGYEFNKVYLIMVTDEHYNANDSYNKEIIDALGSGSERVGEFYKEYNTVSKEYRFKYIDEISIENKFKSVIYEVVPNVISLGSVVEIPADLNIKRIRGAYKIQFDAKSFDKNYSLKQISVTVSKNLNKNTEIFSDAVNMEINTSFVDDNKLNITLHGWLQQNDSVYGALIMNPYDEEYSRHLTLIRNISVENEEKVLGFFPLWDIFWWWFPSNLHMAVLIWDWILIFISAVIIGIIVIIYVKKITKYFPNDNKIKIERI